MAKLKPIVCIFFLVMPALAWGEIPKEREFLHYDVKVFNFLRTLDLKMEFLPTEQADLYLAQLSLKPVGVLKMLMPYRSCEFRSTLRRLPNSKRLRPERFEKVLVTDRVYRGVYLYDYGKGIVTGQGFFNDEPLKPEEFALPKEAGVYYDDFLSFIYNIRSGGYGELKSGETVLIHTVPTRKERIFELQAVSDKISQFQPVKGAAYLVMLRLNEKFLGIHVDRFFLWLSQDYLPIYAVLKDVLGWGDIVGSFRGTESVT